MTISQSLLSKLKDPSLVTDKALVAGEWVAKSDSGKTFDVTNPANGEVIATLPDMNRAETARAIEPGPGPAVRRCSTSRAADCRYVLRAASFALGKRR